MKNFTHSSSTKNVDVVIEDVKAFDENGTEIDLPSKVGFYAKSPGDTDYGYHLQPNMTFITVSDNGIPFQASGSAGIEDNQQVTIRMKAKVIFYKAE